MRRRDQLSLAENSRKYFRRSGARWHTDLRNIRIWQSSLWPAPQSRFPAATKRALEDRKRQVPHSRLRTRPASSAISGHNPKASRGSQVVHTYSPAARRPNGNGGANSRSCVKEGTIPRALSTRERSNSATITPGSSPPSTKTSPQGATTNEWP